MKASLNVSAEEMSNVKQFSPQTEEQDEVTTVRENK